MADCVRRFSRLTARQTAVLDYAFDQDKNELEILVDMHEWVLARYELLSLAPDIWMSSPMVSMMARALTVAGGYRYYFDVTFGEVVYNFQASRKTPRVQNCRPLWPILSTRFHGV